MKRSILRTVCSRRLAVGGIALLIARVVEATRCA
jgi:hypothetical protein